MRTSILFAASLLLQAPIVFAAPIIKSATTSVAVLNDGGTFTLTVVAESDTKVNWLNNSFDGPQGNIEGGGSGVTFQNTNTNEWTYTRSFTISKWAPSGSYKFTSLSVQNEAREESAAYAGPAPTVQVNNSRIATTPVIRAVNTSTAYLQDGGSVTLEVVAESNAPVNWLNSSFEGPNGNIFGGGSGATFNYVGNNIWVYKNTQTISKWAPSGTYYFSGISVQNAGQLSSTEYQHPLKLYVNNTQQAVKPVIQSVTVSPATLPAEGGSFVITVTAKSNAPVNWLNDSFEGPTGNIEGGGSGAQFTEISQGIWQYKRTFTIPAASPKGDYVFTQLSVANEGHLTSSDWATKPTVTKQ